MIQLHSLTKSMFMRANCSSSSSSSGSAWSCPGRAGGGKSLAYTLYPRSGAPPSKVGGDQAIATVFRVVSMTRTTPGTPGVLTGSRHSTSGPGSDGRPAPALFSAVTRNSYQFPSIRLVHLHRNSDTSCLVHRTHRSDRFSRRSTWYPLMSFPPSVDGRDHVTVIESLVPLTP